MMWNYVSETRCKIYDKMDLTVLSCR